MAVLGSVRHSRPATKLLDHIRELQRRLLISFVALVLSGTLIYFFYTPILNFLRSPLNAPLFYSTPAGSFSFVMKICFMGALAIAIPVIVFNLIMFIRPAFSKAVPVRRVVATSAFSAILAFTGAAFGFYYILPGALHFFAGFQVSGLSALISADSYLGFVTNVIITFILVFQIPLLIGFIDRIKPLDPKKLIKNEKWVVLGSLIIAVLVPFAFDLVTTLLIALPIVILYNLSILIIVLQHAYARRQEKASQPRVNLSTIPSSNLAFEELSFEELVGETASTPAASQAPVVAINKQAVMDIRRVNTAPATVQPADWVNRVHDPIPLNPRARLVSF